MVKWKTRVRVHGYEYTGMKKTGMENTGMENTGNELTTCFFMQIAKTLI